MGKLIEGEVSEELHSKDADLLWKVRLFNYLAYESVAFVSLLTNSVTWGGIEMVEIGGASIGK